MRKVTREKLHSDNAPAEPRRRERPGMGHDPGHCISGGQHEKRDPGADGEHDPADQVGRAADDQHTERGVGDRRHHVIQARDPIADLQVVPRDKRQGHGGERRQQRSGPQCGSDAAHRSGLGGRLLRWPARTPARGACWRSGELHARHHRDTGSLTGPARFAGLLVRRVRAKRVTPSTMNARNCGNGRAPRNAAYWANSSSAAARNIAPFQRGSARVRTMATPNAVSAAGASRAKYAVPRPGRPVCGAEVPIRQGGGAEQRAGDRQVVGGRGEAECGADQVQRPADPRGVAVEHPGEKFDRSDSGDDRHRDQPGRSEPRRPVRRRHGDALRDRVTPDGQQRWVDYACDKARAGHQKQNAHHALTRPGR